MKASASPQKPKPIGRGAAFKTKHPSRFGPREDVKEARYGKAIRVTSFPKGGKGGKSKKQCRFQRKGGARRKSKADEMSKGGAVGGKGTRRKSRRETKIKRRSAARKKKNTHLEGGREASSGLTEVRQKKRGRKSDQRDLVRSLLQ